MGDIGEPVRKREYVPMPESEPVHEPNITPEPAKVPDREVVPA